MCDQTRSGTDLFAACMRDQVPLCSCEHSSRKRRKRLCAYQVATHYVAAYGCESWTPRKSEETRLDAFEIKGLRKILRVSWTAKKTNEWVLNKAGVKRELLDTVKARKLAYYGHTVRKQGVAWRKR